MEELYEKSIQAIKNLEYKPSRKEWTKIAREYNFLSATSLSAIYGKSFTELCTEIRKKDKDKETF